MGDCSIVWVPSSVLDPWPLRRWASNSLQLDLGKCVPQPSVTRHCATPIRPLAPLLTAHVRLEAYNLLTAFSADQGVLAYCSWFSHQQLQCDPCVYLLLLAAPQGPVQRRKQPAQAVNVCSEYAVAALGGIMLFITTEPTDLVNPTSSWGPNSCCVAAHYNSPAVTSASTPAQLHHPSWGSTCCPHCHDSQEEPQPGLLT